MHKELRTWVPKDISRQALKGSKVRSPRVRKATPWNRNSCYLRSTKGNWHRPHAPQTWSHVILTKTPGAQYCRHPYFPMRTPKRCVMTSPRRREKVWPRNSNQVGHASTPECFMTVSSTFISVTHVLCTTVTTAKPLGETAQGLHEEQLIESLVFVSQAVPKGFCIQLLCMCL